MKYLIIPCLFIQINLFAQSGEDHPLPDSSLVVSFPWYDNNQYLLDYIDERGYYDNNWGQGGSNTRVCSDARYQIPVKAHVYLDDAGNQSTNIKINDINKILDKANEEFLHTGIQFYIQDIEYKNNENRRTSVDSFYEVRDFFKDERELGLVNIHFIYSSTFNNEGYAITPYFNKRDLYEDLAENILWSCYVTTIQNDNEKIANSLAHELGHVLGLLHTHHPGRQLLKALFKDKENGEISNACYQEVVSRTAQNKFLMDALKPEAKSGVRSMEISYAIPREIRAWSAIILATH